MKSILFQKYFTPHFRIISQRTLENASFFKIVYFFKLLSMRTVDEVYSVSKYFTTNFKERIPKNRRSAITVKIQKLTIDDRKCFF